ncbi:MAG: UDP-N-acetylglucosamine--N-acetylmuramyl-(pentapeptide) pyrophosphoryl-undecaprenol N-acetylglucosamine transferase [Bacteroidota bacterium]|nr:UDP-N-acetylglucosamine--N-acetylmuramyl-(pentapeptide) pyrophosphoryl-undecaprenol N-acetylglucosamine transferase [Bacteroidota bacterium]
MQNPSAVSILVAAGGTGGDLFPVLAVVERLRQLGCPQGTIEPLFVGNPDRIEGRILPARGYSFVPIPMRGYYGVRSLRTYSLAWRLPSSILRVWHAVLRVRPRLALLAGAYLGIPAGIVARLHRIPIVLVEINATPGKANRLLARWAHQILASSEECRAAFPAAVRSRVVVTGTPIRPALQQLPPVAQARMRFGLAPDRPVLLVLGGSLGAHSINRAIAAHLTAICACGWQILWQTGSAEIPSSPPGVVVLPFIEDMASAYAAAELAISRAGGSTVAELAVTKTPAILVPYPHAANREQDRNAAFLAHSGGAVVIADTQLDHALWQVLAPLLGDPERRSQMRRALGEVARPHATDEAATILRAMLCGD